LNTCAVCGEPVTTRTRIESFTGWETGDGELVARETIAVVHPECYMRLPPAEREALISRLSVDENDEEEA
jgi:hypothetical protein